MSFISVFIVDPIRNHSIALAKFRWMQLMHERPNGDFKLAFGNQLAQLNASRMQVDFLLKIVQSVAR